MIKRTLFGTLVFSALLVVVGYAAYVRNEPPVVAPVSVDDARTAVKPYVVKLHAQWCVVCMVTKDVWTQIEQTYAGRTNLVVLDFTNAANTAASQAEAKRLGLETFYDEYAGATGTIVVLDGRTKAVTAEINGSRDFAEYRAAIDAALDNVSRR